MGWADDASHLKKKKKALASAGGTGLLGTVIFIDNGSFWNALEEVVSLAGPPM